MFYLFTLFIKALSHYERCSITHNTIGSSFLSTAVTMMGVSPIATKNLAITRQMDIEQGITEANRLCHELDEGDGILIITDTFGLTPGNVATKLLKNIPHGSRIIVTGY